jgi:predicted lipid-binding transport protein (Tim44 family)
LQQDFAMTTRFFVALAALLTLFVFCSSIEAEAARFGGGRSFGGSPSFNRPAPSSQLPGGMRNPSAAQQQPVAAAAARPGMGMMGGMMGGLLAGTLIGSLLSGHGFAGGGMFDILLIGLGLYLLFKFLGRRRAAQSGQTNVGLRMPVPEDLGQGQNPGMAKSGMWDVLGGRSADSGADAQNNVPAGFAREEFLRGAKILYQRMNDSWDKRDLNDIAEFSTQPFMAEIRRQAAESPDPGKTDIMLVNADLVSVVCEAGRETASVCFNVTLREDPGQSAPIQVHEVWHFVRAVGSSETWKLDGIQQVENS